MGYNPYRKHEASMLDYVLLGAAAVVAGALVVWGFLG